MILLKLIKKEIKQFFRNKTDVITMFIFPIVLILVMGVALNGLMNVEQNIFKEKIIYYNTNNLGEDNKYIIGFNKFIESIKDVLDISFEEIKNIDKAMIAVDSEEALVFINIKEDNYNLYRGKDKETSEQMIFRSVFEQYLKKYALGEVIVSENKDVLEDIDSTAANIKIVKEGINKSGINSFTYYTFAELVLIILYISSITSVSMYKEEYLNTISRFRLSKINYFSIILSKLFLGVIIGTIQIVIVYIFSTGFLKVCWGENIAQMFIVLIGLIIFSSALGISSILIFREHKTASIVSNIAIIIMGFLGGSYMPISLIKSINITNFLCNLTPTYWANISLLSLSSNINVSYIGISLFISLGLSFILIIIGIFVNRMRVGGKIA